MTLAIQNKGKTYLNNESIFNNIIKKENGVNPFLTVMNFKISFKTWLKHAKTKARIEESKKAGVEINPDEEASLFSKKVKTVIVDIEVEHDKEYTTEEDVEDLDSQFGGPRYGQSQGSGGSQMGSSRDLSNLHKKKDKDHMASFSKKMSSKLKDRIAQTGGISKQPTVKEKPPKPDSLNQSLRKSLSRALSKNIDA